MRDYQDWVSTNDQLPAAGEEVLCRSSELQALGYIDASNRWHFEDGTPFDGVTRWMRLELPTPERIVWFPDLAGPIGSSSGLRSFYSHS
jgi:hypothetical protein